MLINPTALHHWINHFYGYGSWDARIWFVSHEESGGDVPDDVADRIDYFHSAHAATQSPVLCDIRELYRHLALQMDGSGANLFATRHDYRFGPHAKLHGVWKNLIAFVHGYQGKELPDLLTCQQNSFLVPATHQEALIRLYPLPAQNDHAWYYSWLDLPQFPFLKSRNGYQKHLFATRIRMILERIVRHKPEVVLMYGMEHIDRLKKSMLAQFPEAKFKMVKAVKRQIPQHHRADLSGTSLVITTQIPALRHGRIETGFDWYEFGKAARFMSIDQKAPGTMSPRMG